jgi:hypothetical protein
MRALLIALIVLVQATTVAPPAATIRGGELEAQLYLPDSASGYYRGTRFDWSGVVSSLRWNGHEYFGQWFERYDPLLHDAITGPVEEFLTGEESALGYDEAQVGGAFVRIGVGAVRKPAEKSYQRFGTYEIVDPGEWSVERSGDRITFQHVLGDTGGYAYRYRKTLRLEGRRLVLSHRLDNQGARAIGTSVYDHNFFTLDAATTGPALRVILPFDARALRSFEDRAAIDGRTIRFLRPFGRGETVFSEIAGFGPTPRDYDFRIENTASGAGVHITGDQPLSKLLFWSAEKTVCPEPYISLSIAPGASAEWTITYEFYEVEGGEPGAGR